jgi:N-acetylmuramoyl-L-alanine amidase
MLQRGLTTILLIFACLSTPCWGAEPVRLVVDGSKIFLHTEPLLVDGTVYVPLTALGALGARCQVAEGEKRDGQKIKIISASGKEFTCRARLINDALMIPIQDVAPELGAVTFWDEKTSTLSLRAKIESIEFDGLELRVTTSYPIKFEPDFWASAGKLILDLHGVNMPTKQEEVPIRNNTDIQIRTGVRNNGETGRIVLDLGRQARYRILSSRKTSRVSLLISDSEPRKNLPQPTSVVSSSSRVKNSKETESPQDEKTLLNNNVQPVIEVPLLTVTDVSYKILNSQVEVHVSTNGKVKYTTSMTRNPNRLMVDIENASLGKDFGSMNVGHEILDAIHVSQHSDKRVRITIDLTRVAGWDVRQSFDELVINLLMPKGAGGSLSDKIVVIDPGHGGNDPGAIGCDGWKEKDSNYAIAEKVRQLLVKKGVCALLTRGPDNALDADKARDLAKRAEFAARHSADMFISIHGNSVAGSKCPSGIETYYHGTDPNGRALAYCIHSEVVRESGLPDLKVRSDYTLYKTGLGVLRGATSYGIPAVLIELGYVKHPGDVAKLRDPEFQQRMAEAIVRGIRAYVEGG